MSTGIFYIINDDIRDASTPEAMSELLLKLFTQQILKPESKALILAIMRSCETGTSRLKGLLPPGTEVRHKTGTIGMTTNDVGIIYLSRRDKFSGDEIIVSKNGFPRVVLPRFCTTIHGLFSSSVLK